MITNPDIIFDTDPEQGLVARSGWAQHEARAVLRDLGWHWEEELHALVPPDDVADADAGVQAVEELHLHGYRTGYATGPYGVMRLNRDRAEQVFVKLEVRQTAAPADDHQSSGTRCVELSGELHRPRQPYKPYPAQPHPEVQHEVPSI